MRTNQNEKLKGIFKKRKYDKSKWQRVIRTIYALDDFHETNIEEANPELARLLRINSAKRLYSHDCDGDPECGQCEMYKDVI
jgi:hypothetical protein